MYIVFIIISVGFFLYSFEQAYSETYFPSWIKQSTLWWSQGKITDQEFIDSMQYLINEKIVIIPKPELGNDSICGPGSKINATYYQLTHKVQCIIQDERDFKGIFPDSFAIHQKIVASWVKNTALQWAQDKITDLDFGQTMQYLAQEKILALPNLTYEMTPNVRPSQATYNISKKIPSITLSSTDIERIDDFVVLGYYATGKYNLRFTLLDINKREVARDGTISLSIVDNKNRILYLDAFSIRQNDFVEMWITSSNDNKLVYAWDIDSSKIKRGYGTFGIAKIVFIDRAGNQFSNTYDKVPIPQFE
jgi:hypothetical protein